MAGEHDFAPLSEAEIDYYAEQESVMTPLARELRASRAAMRALVEAWDARERAEAELQEQARWPAHTPEDIAALQAKSKEVDEVRYRHLHAESHVRALVAHVEKEGD